VRAYYKQILRSFFHARLTAVYNTTDATQAEMALLLSMDLRSFSDLAQGKCCCSALTFARFLIYFCPDQTAFLKDLQAAFEAEIPAFVPVSLSRAQLRCPACNAVLPQKATLACPICGTVLNQQDVTA